MTPRAPVRILLAEDVHMVRGALVALLEQQPDLEVVAQTERGDAILALAEKHRPDVAVIDVDLPGMDGVTAARRLQETLPACRALILTGIAEPGLLARCLQAGVTGLLHKYSPPETLARAVRDVADGRRVIDPEIALTTLTEAAEMALLSPREVEVLRLTAAGNSPQEVAKTLHLSIGTVRNHITSIKVRLNARTVVDAVNIAKETGLLR